MKRIPVSPLSWGLGHATRDLPVIHHLPARGHHVTLAAEGRALDLLRHEAPECEFLHRYYAGVLAGVEQTDVPQDLDLFAPILD